MCSRATRCVTQSLPASWQHIIEKVGIQVALDLTYDATKKYIPARFTEEIQVRVHALEEAMVPCSLDITHSPACSVHATYVARY